jgi:hypothetical protein
MEASMTSGLLGFALGVVFVALCALVVFMQLKRVGITLCFIVDDGYIKKVVTATDTYDVLPEGAVSEIILDLHR